VTARPSGKARWVAAYALVAIAPLIATLALSDLPGRTFVLELASALGIIALTLLALQLMLPSRLRAVAGPLGADVAVRLHRRMADVLVAAIVAHVALVFADDLSRLELLDTLPPHGGE
jgi:predicted ferric reductase